MSATDSVLQLLHVSKAYQNGSERMTPLNNVTVAVKEGAFITITGPSGTGKSTLFRLLTRLEEPDSGQIFYRNRPLTEQDPPILRRRVHYVFQSPVLFPGTVADNLSYPVQLAGETLPRSEMEALLTRVSLPASYLSRSIKELSGGEKQRVNIARSLSLSPDVLLLDEPTSALDHQSAAYIEHEILSYHKEGHTVLWITHSPEQAKRLGSSTWHLENGRVEERSRQ
ncbi:ABC transporter ATP-binding protein [Aneurinibacillus sp. REN35]|uniref:ABC transporter ATP-binding protein n=1 Tax=Aneurinibacillus sp. REN35 TaxID=3237286 RepID=UPI0035280201